jgi:uncharacterized protein YjbJ (UPF0337 family)
MALQRVGGSLPRERPDAYRSSQGRARCSRRKERPASRKGEEAMNQDRIQGRWRQIKGKVKEQWGRLTEDDLDVIAGRREQLLGRIQQRHGMAKDDAKGRPDDQHKPR